MARKKIAVIGCGYWGKNLIRNFHELGCLEVVCDDHPERQQLARELAPGVRVVKSFSKVLATDVDGVVIATPAPTHHPLALKSLEAGKDTFVEKPLALTLEQGQDLLAKAGTNTILMVGHILEYHPACRKLVELVHAGELGELRYLYSNRLSLGKVRREENILWSFAPHDVALAIRITGQVPTSVAAFGGTYLQSEIADVTVTNLIFPGGVRGHIHVSWLHPFKEQRLVVIGSQKMAAFNGVTGEITCYDQRVDLEGGEPIPVKGAGQNIPVDTTEPLRLECQAFLDAIATRQPPLTSGFSGLQTLAVLEAAQASLQNCGRLVPVRQPLRHSQRL